MNTQALANTIEVFTTRSMPIDENGVNIRLCQMDLAASIDKELSEVVFDGQNIEEVEALASQKAEAFVEFSKCQLRAKLLGIEKLPAIVINESYVTYGVRSVSEALSSLAQKEYVHE